MNRLQGVVFDWAGTLIDHGSFAPTGAFVEAFGALGIDTTVEAARGPMGLPKRDHVAAMFALPDIASQWREAYGAAPDDAAIDRVYAGFVPASERAAAARATLVPGALEALAWLRERAIRIGTTTGYTRSIMAGVLPDVARQGFVPDLVVCSDDLPRGRPGPFGMYRCFAELSLHPPSAVLKLDDTAPGIAEGVSAGSVGVGVTLSGNHAALSVEALEALGEPAREAVRTRVGAMLAGAGAAHLIDSVADLPGLIERLESDG